MPVIHLDKVLFYRALLNILVNALQAMDDNGQLQLSTRKSSVGGTELVIVDNGIGMSPEKVEQILEPFFTDKNK
jgi:two-component system sensor histidine kinase HydH